MGYIEVKEVKEYLIHIRGEEELELFTGMILNCNPVSEKMKAYKEHLTTSLQKHSKPGAMYEVKK